MLCVLCALAVMCYSCCHCMVVTDRNDSSLLAVVLFVHGETYELGTGNAYDGSVMAAYGHVIVITINYRVGVLGRTSSG